jgi:cell wall-associated NlpC family hydrolase
MSGPLRVKKGRAIGLVWTLALAAVTGACASTGAVPRPFPAPGTATVRPPDVPVVEPATPRPSITPDVPSPASDSIPAPRVSTGLDSYALIGTALALRGTPYRNGGTDPNGFDCSGFTQYVFSRYGVALPRDVRSQYRTGVSVLPEELTPGDLIFFVTAEPDVSHVAIAIGGDEFVHAPSSTGVVRVEHLSASYWSRRYAGARRVAK